jgi:hypothetical protein
MKPPSKRTHRDENQKKEETRAQHTQKKSYDYTCQGAQCNFKEAHKAIIVYIIIFFFDNAFI